MLGVSLIVFPKLALGMSGFETGVAVMPHVSGDATDTESHPAGRIRGTKRLLTTAAVMMSVFLVTSSFVTTLLIPPAAVRARRSRQRPRPGLPGARVPRQRLRHDVRRLDDRDPLVRGRLGDGRHAQPDPALPPALRHVARVGRRRPPARPDPDRHGVPDHLDLRRERRRPGRRVRDRGPGALHQRRRRGDPRRPTGRTTQADVRLRRDLAGLRLHDRQQRDRAAGRREDRRLLRPGDRRGLASLSRIKRVFELRATEIDFDAAEPGLRPRLRATHDPAGRAQDRATATPTSTSTRSASCGATTTCRRTPTSSSSRSPSSTPATSRVGSHVRGEVLHGRYRVMTVTAPSVPERPCRAGAPDPRRLRSHPAHLLRVDRGQPGPAVPAVPALRARRGRAGHPRGPASGRARPGTPAARARRLRVAVAGAARGGHCARGRHSRRPGPRPAPGPARLGARGRRPGGADRRAPGGRRGRPQHRARGDALPQPGRGRGPGRRPLAGAGRGGGWLPCCSTTSSSRPAGRSTSPPATTS